MASTVKENSLNKQIKLSAALFAELYGRIVTDALTGDSKIMQHKDMLFNISNIDNLQTIINGLQTLVAGSESEIPIFDALGQIESSNFKIGTFDTIESLDLCTQQGLYTASDVVDVPIVGDVQFSFVVLGHRLLFGSNGLWHCVYSSSWSLPRYVGGAFDNITISYADAVDLATNGQLSPGAAYKITGVGQDEGIILRAASADTFETDGIRLGLVPAHFEAGTFDSVTWLGAWRDTLTPSAGNVVVFMGRVWENNTGVVGNIVNDWFLDADNWTLVDPLIGVNEGFYVREVFGCTYRLVSNLPLVFTTGYVSRQWDSRGNSFGIEVEPVDGFKVEYNDFGCEYVYNNSISRCYNNRYKAGAGIYGNTGSGSIHSNDLCNQVEYEISEIYENVLISSNIYGNNVANSAIYWNTLRNNSYISHNSMVDSSGISLTMIDGFITLNTLTSITDTIIKNGGGINEIDFNNYKIYKSYIASLLTNQTLTSDQYIRDDLTPFKATDGETLKLATPVWDDLNFNLSTIKVPASNAPTWTSFDTHLNAYTWALNDIADLGSLEYLHKCKEGEDFVVHVHFSTNGANNATERKVKYTAYYSILLPTGAWSAEQSITAEATILANEVSKTGHKLDLGTISGASLLIGSQIKLSLSRVASTGTEPINNPFVTSVGLHVKIDTMGSRSISTK